MFGSHLGPNQLKKWSGGAGWCVVHVNTATPPLQRSHSNALGCLFRASQLPSSVTPGLEWVRRPLCGTVTPGCEGGGGKGRTVAWQGCPPPELPWREGDRVERLTLVGPMGASQEPLLVGRSSYTGVGVNGMAAKMDPGCKGKRTRNELGTPGGWKCVELPFDEW